MLHMKQDDGNTWCTINLLSDKQKELVAHFGYASGVYDGGGVYGGGNVYGGDFDLKLLRFNILSIRH